RRAGRGLLQRGGSQQAAPHQSAALADAPLLVVPLRTQRRHRAGYLATLGTGPARSGSGSLGAGGLVPALRRGRALRGDPARTGRARLLERGAAAKPSAWGSEPPF